MKNIYNQLCLCLMLFICISISHAQVKKTEATLPKDDRPPIREENITALSAKRIAEKKLHSLGKKGDLLLVVSNSTITWENEDAILSLTNQSWVFVFSDQNEEPVCIEVGVEKKQGEGLKTYRKISNITCSRELVLFNKPITNFDVDNDKAEILARERGGSPFGSGQFMLRMSEVDGISMPIWRLPYHYRDAIVRGFRADNGETVYMIDKHKDKWTLNSPEKMELNEPPQDLGKGSPGVLAKKTDLYQLDLANNRLVYEVDYVLLGLKSLVTLSLGEKAILEETFPEKWKIIFEYNSEYPEYFHVPASYTIFKFSKKTGKYDNLIGKYILRESKSNRLFYQNEKGEVREHDQSFFRIL